MDKKDSSFPKECYNYRKDSSGKVAKICYNCTYYSLKISKKNKVNTSCWSYLKCDQRCKFRINADDKFAKSTVVEKSVLKESQTRLKNTIARLKAVQNSIKKPKKKDNIYTQKSYELLAQAIKTMLKER